MVSMGCSSLRLFADKKCRGMLVITKFFCGDFAGILRGSEGALMVLLMAEGATNAYTAWFFEVTEAPKSHL